jgi:hypothetical protein
VLVLLCFGCKHVFFGICCMWELLGKHVPIMTEHFGAAWQAVHFLGHAVTC